MSGADGEDAFIQQSRRLGEAYVRLLRAGPRANPKGLVKSDGSQESATNNDPITVS